MKIPQFNNQIMFGQNTKPNPKLIPIIKATENINSQYQTFSRTVSVFRRANQGNKELLEEAVKAIDETVKSAGIKGNLLALVDAAKKLLRS